MSIFKIKNMLLGSALCIPIAAQAQEITLRSADGSINLSGDLIEYQDNVYVISSPFGPLHISGDTVACSGAACPNVEVLDREVTFSGSATIASGLLPVLLESYASSLDSEARPTEALSSAETGYQFISDSGFGDFSAFFRVRSSISSDAFANLLGKSAEIGVSSRRITVEEARMLRDYGAGSMVSTSNEHILATDSIIIVTHPANPVGTLSLNQLAAIYSGSISNWSEVGGKDAPINAIHFGRGSGTRSIFEERILDGNVGQPVNTVEVSGSIDVSRHIEQDENALGYVSYAFKRGTQALTLVNQCGIEMEPNEFTAKTGEYVLQRPLYFYTRDDTRTPETEAFLEWAKSPAADLGILKPGFINLSVSSIGQQADSVRVKNLKAAALDSYERDTANSLIDLMGSYERLTPTFRFRSGSSRLLPQSRIVLERLIDYLEAQPAGEIMLVGFTDEQGPFDANINTSKERAAAMAAQIYKAAGNRLDHITFDTAGFGELSPVACNANETGRAINRRIEVWRKTANAAD